MTLRRLLGIGGHRRWQNLGRVLAAFEHEANNILFRQRRVWLLLTVSLLLGVLYSLTMLPVSVIAGNAPFWRFPNGTIPGSDTDMADFSVAHLYLAQAPWQLPLLLAPNLGPPPGTNVFWLDPVPWVLLAAKLVYKIGGILINPFGIFVFGCFCLPGVAMTALLAAAGERNIVAAVSGTVFAGAMPFLLFRWGHTSLLAQFWIIVAFVCYLFWLRHPCSRRIEIMWLAVLSVTLLTNIYLFAMVGAVWAAAAVQRRVNGVVSNRRLLGEFAVASGILMGIMLLTGILSPDLRFVASDGFGIYSMNLFSPIVPQMSGLIPPLNRYMMGHLSQYEGYAYMGAGALIIIAASLPGWFAWGRRRAQSHVSLICVLTVFSLFALSHKVYIGSHLILELPLSDRLVHAFGTFRSSGRFFWPVGYGLIAGSLLLVLRRFRRSASLALLTLAATLQLIDVEPLRAAISANVLHPRPDVFDRQRVTSLAVRSRAVLVFPSFGCIDDLQVKGMISPSEKLLLRQANMEMQIITATANLPINSVNNSRPTVDCAAEEHLQRQPLQIGVLYVYLLEFIPTAAQLGGRTPDRVCSDLDWLHYCLIIAGGHSNE